MRDVPVVAIEGSSADGQLPQCRGWAVADRSAPPPACPRMQPALAHAANAPWPRRQAGITTNAETTSAIRSEAEGYPELSRVIRAKILPMVTWVVSKLSQMFFLAHSALIAARLQGISIFKFDFRFLRTIQEFLRHSNHGLSHIFPDKAISSMPHERQ